MIDETEGGKQMGNEGNDWTTQTLAEAAGVTDAYIRYLLIKGDLQGEKFSRVWRIPYAVGLQWLQSRKRTP
jgi:hypothetical protein